MTTLDQAFHDAILRKNRIISQRCLMTLNPGFPYLPNWHISAIAHQLDRIRRGEITRLIINMPPRHLKSLTVSVAFPAFLPVLNLGIEFLQSVTAANSPQSMLTTSGSIVESSRYRRAFRAMQISRSLEDEVTTTAREFRKATSVYGTLTGLGGDIFIIDDPQKPVDAQSDTQRNRLIQWVANTLMSRLDSKETGVIIVVMQRVHLDDSERLPHGNGRLDGAEPTCDRGTR